MFTFHHPKHTLVCSEDSSFMTKFQMKQFFHACISCLHLCELGKKFHFSELLAFLHIGITVRHVCFAKLKYHFMCYPDPSVTSSLCFA